MSHTIRDKQSLKPEPARFRAGDTKMLDEPHECAAVLQQIAATARCAVNGLMRAVTAASDRIHRSSGVDSRDVKKIYRVIKR